MKTITNIEDFWKAVTEITIAHSKNKIATLRISTFGLFSFSSGTSHVKTYFDLLGTLKFDKIQMAIGMSKFGPCKKECLDCYNKYCKSLATMKYFLKQYPFLNIEHVYDTHMKLFMAHSVDKKNEQVCDYIVGGINFGDSQWNDSAVVLEGKNKPLIDLFDFVFNDAPRFDFVPLLVPDEPAPTKGVINFGKYKGKTWIEVQKENPGYIAWCLEQKNITVEL